MKRKITTKNSRKIWKRIPQKIKAAFSIICLLLTIIIFINPFDATAEVPVLSEPEIEEGFSRENLDKMPEKQRKEWLFAAGKSMAEIRHKQIQERSSENSPERENRSNFREKIQMLNDDERRAFMEGSREIMHKAIVERARKFINASEEEKEQMMKENMERFRRRRPPERQSSSNKSDSKNSETPPRPRRRKMTREAREEHFRSRLNSSTPEERAIIQEYFRQMREYRQRSRG